MDKKKYDVAISFAEEDVEVAESISKALSALSLTNYFYKHEQGQQLGENIFEIILKKYRDEAHLALCIISKNYVAKKWAQIEIQVIQTVKNDEHAYMIPLRIDDSLVKGLSDNTLYLEWRGNPEQIATVLHQKLNAIKSHPRDKDEENLDKESKGLTINQKTIGDNNEQYAANTININKRS